MNRATTWIFWITFIGAISLKMTAPALAAPEAQNGVLGRWRFDSTRSTFVGDAPYRSGTYTFTATEEGVHVVADIILASGQTLHFEYRDPEDGTYVPVRGNPFYDSESTIWTDNRAATRTELRDGQIVGIMNITVGKDGESYSASARRTLPDGRLYTSVIFWNRVNK